ncbi:hypothetical protein BGZ82_003003, partial [Podila clonocystis]
VTNKEPIKMQIFFGDKDGNPFMYQEVETGEAANFNEDTEIAIVAVRGYQESQVLRSDIEGAWMKFKVKDTQDNNGNKMFVEYKFGGTYEAYGGSTAKFEQHGPEVPVFPPKLMSKTMAALSTPRAMEVEI